MKKTLKSPYFTGLLFLVLSFFVTLFPPFESKNGTIWTFDFLFSGSQKYYTIEKTKNYKIYSDEKFNPQILETAIKYNVTQGIETRRREKAVKAKYPYKVKKVGRLNIDWKEIKWELSNNYETYTVNYTNYNVTQKERVYFTGYLSVSKLIMEYGLCFIISTIYLTMLLLKNKSVKES